jgi:hypothetical protein
MDFPGPGATPAEVRAAVGPPAFTDEAGASWYYAIRDVGNSGGCCVPAPRLELEFDAGRTLRGWRFVHPVTGRRLPVEETLAEFERWRAGLCSRLPFILMSEFVPGATKAVEVELRMFDQRVRWHDDYGRFWARRHVQTSPDGEVWTFYVDRPSVVFIPASLYHVGFRNGRVSIGGGPDGYATRGFPLLGCGK